MERASRDCKVVAAVLSERISYCTAAIFHLFRLHNKKALTNLDWFPLCLAGLSVAGILLGMLLHVRSFLFLGTRFLFVVVAPIIWRAAREQFWVWWSSGIILGASILAVFAVIEKRGQRISELLDQLRLWE